MFPTKDVVSLLKAKTACGTRSVIKTPSHYGNVCLRKPDTLSSLTLIIEDITILALRPISYVPRASCLVLRI
ncbi:hypothetical protein AB205_0133450 [Aquarana catesbeiana]|uniref:Uncharacterized protein n=1 Tax=Aquarana catesbeiana TaxID=8400 RepID=A0A2G9NB77_AQUCT|nr:hypothetical protein AB205_0133450 [Aquarana catesbeiana]